MGGAPPLVIFDGAVSPFSSLLDELCLCFFLAGRTGEESVSEGGSFLFPSWPVVCGEAIDVRSFGSCVEMAGDDKGTDLALSFPLPLGTGLESPSDSVAESAEIDWSGILTATISVSTSVIGLVISKSVNCTACDIQTYEQKGRNRWHNRCRLSCGVRNLVMGRIQSGIIHAAASILSTVKTHD